MKTNFTILMSFIVLFCQCKTNESAIESNSKQEFDIANDLLLVNYDCKTDVDDLHSIAAFAMLLMSETFQGLNYHAVTGTYGIQEGLYVPPNKLFRAYFDDNWTDAHKDYDKAIERVHKIVLKTLKEGGNIWIAEAGQSDFSASLIESLQKGFPQLNTSKQIFIVQHSDWNEKQTSPEKLQFVKENTTYLKIPDGNVVGNGSPGFCSPTSTQALLNSKLKNIWNLALELAITYNGKDGRYNNKVIEAGGFDFQICQKYVGY